MLIVLALVIGHLVGGPDEDDRTALAIACATCHIGIAVLVATSVPGPRTAVVIAVYIAISLLVSLPYLRWRRAVAARREVIRLSGVGSAPASGLHRGQCIDQGLVPRLDQSLACVVEIDRHHSAVASTKP